MRPADITPVLLTWNEEANIARSLEALHWAHRIVVLDSGSKDETEWICRSNPRVAFHVRPFDCHADQWNAAVALAATPWILALDADYRVTAALADEIRALPDDPPVNAYAIRLDYCVNGKPLRSSLLPPRLSLFRREHARYTQDGHTQDLAVDGATGTLVSPILHDDRKPFRRWWSNQQKYARLESEKLKHTPWLALSPQDRLRKYTPLAPLAVIGFCLFLKGLWRDIPAGWIYTAQRTLAEALLCGHLLLRLLSRK